MPLNEILDILMFVVVCGFLMAGFPVAFTLAGTGLAFASIAWSFGLFDFSLFGALPSRIYGNSMTNEVLIAVPLFVFMGVMLERSKVAEELLDSMGMLFGKLRGGLAISVTIVGALLAASTGIVGATVVTMGLLSLPTMLRRGYDPKLAAGSNCAAGTLGQIIPPSIVLVLLADQLSNAYVDAQRALGNFSPDPLSVGDLFAGALLPGLALVGMYILYQIGTPWLRPETSPAIPAEEIDATGLAERVLHALVPPIVLIIGVLGSILSGIATPTEAAAVGAIGALYLAGMRMADGKPMAIYIAGLSLVVVLILTKFMDLRVARDVIPLSDQVGIGVAGLAVLGLIWGGVVSLYRTYRTKVESSGTPVLLEVMQSTLKISAMVFVILIGASVFPSFFVGLAVTT